MSVFKNKVAVITGAGSGIGRALGEELARRGAVVALSDVRPERVEEVAAGIRQTGGSASAHVVDVTDYDAVKALIEGVARDQGRLDYMFNNAGIGVIGLAADVGIEDWRRVLAVNLHGVVHGATVAYALMARQGSGHIVNTASIEGLLPFPASASYVTSKFGVIGLSEALRVEGAECGVRVSAVCPGYVTTAIFHDAKIVEMDREKLIGRLPAWAAVTPEVCVRHMLRGVEKNSALIFAPGIVRGLWWLQRHSPWLARRLMRNSLRELYQYGVVK